MGGNGLKIFGSSFLEKFVKLNTVELLSLEHLNLSDKNVLKGIDVLASFSDVFSGGVSEEGFNEVGKGVAGGFLLDIFDHFSSDGLNLG